MRQSLILVLLILILSSCHKEYKQCTITAPNAELKLYNEILIELTEQHFYNFYLGKDKELLKEYYSPVLDTIKIKRGSIELQNKLFNDTARFCTLVLDTAYKYHHYLRPWTYYQNDTISYAKKYVELINSFSDNGQSVIDTLNSLQKKYAADDFHLCTSEIISLEKAQDYISNCFIGFVAFSKIYYNSSKTRGVLIYTFGCGDLCGRTEMIIVEKVKEKWEIKGTILLSIS